MHLTALAKLALLSSVASAAAFLPRQDSTTVNWNVTNFSVESSDCGPTNYQLNLCGEGLDVICKAQNSVASTTCPGANGPAAFSDIRCGDEEAGPGFSWEFVEGNSPVENGGRAYSIRFTYSYPGKPDVYGCSGQYLVSNSSCTGPPGEGEILHVPQSFEVAPTLNNSSQCIYI